MTGSRRMMRRVKIGSLFMLFLFVVIVPSYLLLSPKKTCSDGKKNQGEAGIDCGGPCPIVCQEVFSPESFELRESLFVPTGVSGKYDASVRVYNPNDTIGAASIGYDIVLRDSTDVEVGRFSGTESILPQESKYFFGLGIDVSGMPSSVGIEFHDGDWRRFSGYQERPALTVHGLRYDKVSSGPFFGEVFGTLRNESPFDFRSVTVKVLLRDTSGKTVALNRTEVNTLLSGDVRDFLLRFPSAFPGAVASVDAEVDADFYGETSFVERYRAVPERFQELR